MKNTITGIIFTTMFIITAVANARSCPVSAHTEILMGLENLSTDPVQTEQKQQRAVFVASLIKNSSSVACDFNSGVVGSVFDLETDTHRIRISFAGKTITNLRTERISFN
jgi:hypothetical protein